MALLHYTLNCKGKYHINAICKPPLPLLLLQVIAWCTDQVPFPNMVFVDALNQTRNSVFCHDGLVRHAVFARDSTKIISCGSDGKVSGLG